MKHESKIGISSKAYEDMDAFFHANKSATTLLNAATEDYAAARCLAQNQLITSLIVGAQALEKYLKAYILLVDPSYKARNANHGINKLLTDADRLTPNLNIKSFLPLGDKFAAHYQTRYPDNPRTLMSMSTADIDELDKLVVLLHENLPCPRDVKYRVGLYASVSFSVDHGHVSPLQHWLTFNNVELLALLPRIHADQLEVINQLHPK